MTSLDRFRSRFYYGRQSDKLYYYFKQLYPGAEPGAVKGYDNMYLWAKKVWCGWCQSYCGNRASIICVVPSIDEKSLPGLVCKYFCSYEAISIHCCWQYWYFNDFIILLPTTSGAFFSAQDINDCIKDPEDRECNFRNGDPVDHSIVGQKWKALYGLFDAC